MTGCIVEDCDDEFYAKDCCYKHYLRQYHGRPLEPTPKFSPRPTRRLPGFWRKSTG